MFLVAMSVPFKTAETYRFHCGQHDQGPAYSWGRPSSCRDRSACHRHHASSCRCRRPACLQHRPTSHRHRTSTRRCRQHRPTSHRHRTSTRRCRPHSCRHHSTPYLLRPGTFHAAGCELLRRGTPCAAGDRIPVPDGVERPRPHRNVPDGVEGPAHNGSPRRQSPARSPTYARFQTPTRLRCLTSPQCRQSTPFRCHTIAIRLTSWT